MLLVALALATSGLFKIAAFAREAFIAAKFGLSAVTDAYFALQQLPTTVSSYMFGAFTLAFAPAFAAARRENGTVSWLPGITLSAIAASLVFTGIMQAAAPFLLHAILHSDGSPNTRATLRILSYCFAPVASIGIWAGICSARGQNLWSMTMTGLPFLVMTVWLFGLYAVGRLDNLSLPVSMTAGFGVVGVYALVRIVLLQPQTFRVWALVSFWRIAQFRIFLRQLGASSLENAGFAANQLLILHFLAGYGTGVISGNNCAMRIGMLGYTLMAIPMGQLVQAKLCAAAESERPALFRRWLTVLTVLTAVFAAALFAFRIPLTQAVYMHGKFQNAALSIVAGLLPAWIAYIVVLTMNGIASRYLFTQSRGAFYVRSQLAAYAVANLSRFALAGRLDASIVIWCSVVTEGCAAILNLHNCLTLRVPEKAAERLPATVEVTG
jgi:putative peptidoglycan lipid II flippase